MASELDQVDEQRWLSLSSAKDSLSHVDLGVCPGNSVSLWLESGKRLGSPVTEFSRSVTD